MLVNLIEETREVCKSTQEFLTTHYRYACNENQGLVINPSVAANELPGYVNSPVYGERNVLLSMIMREGLTDPFRSLAAHADIPEQNQISNDSGVFTVTHCYDATASKQM